jgi:hypothetical protein
MVTNGTGRRGIGTPPPGQGINNEAPFASAMARSRVALFLATAGLAAATAGCGTLKPPAEGGEAGEPAVKSAPMAQPTAQPGAATPKPAKPADQGGEGGEGGEG